MIALDSVMLWQKQQPGSATFALNKLVST